jgi:hypothetical protein
MIDIWSGFNDLIHERLKKLEEYLNGKAGSAHVSTCSIRKSMDSNDLITTAARVISMAVLNQVGITVVGVMSSIDQI